MAGALVVWLIGFEDKVVWIAGVGVAAVVMTFGERWGLVPSSEDANKPQTLSLSERDRPAPPDTSGYLDSVDLQDELKDDLWEKVGALTYDRKRRRKPRKKV
jgi:hypothetical protein